MFAIMCTCIMYTYVVKLQYMHDKHTVWYMHDKHTVWYMHDKHTVWYMHDKHTVWYMYNVITKLLLTYMYMYM